LRVARNIFGFQISRSAPRARLAGSNFAARSVLASVASATTPDSQARLTPQLAVLPFVKATGELPATFPTTKQTGFGLPDRSVSSSPQSDYFWQLPSKVPPKQIVNILRQTAAGSLIYQHQLNRLMEESWPLFKKCLLELKLAIASAKYTVHAHCAPGKKPTPSAQDKADLVTRALNAGFQPDRFADEDGVNGMIFDLCEAIPMGVSIVEMLWNEDAIDPNGQNESLVRATGWVNPINITFTPDGRIGVSPGAAEGRMGFGGTVNGVLNNPDKFLVAKFKSKSGTCLTAGLMRSLADIWTLVVYGRDFARLGMQKYGNPFLDIAYDSGITDQGMIRRFEELAALAAANGYCAHPNNSEIKITQGHPMGADNAQIAMMKLADEACQLLLLGQTLTSSVGSSGGNRALGEVHNDVRTERIEEHAKWIARILTEQFADSILRVNYGRSYAKNPERPTIEPDLTRPLSAVEQGQYLVAVSNSKVPVLAEPTYKRAGLEMPQPGDTVLINGEMVVMEEPTTPTEKRQKQFDEQLEQQLQVNQQIGEPSEPEQIEAALRYARPEDKSELEYLVSAAEAAPHKNGEIVAVQTKLKQLLQKTRP
jgi:phage gp29-like protein